MEDALHHAYFSGAYTSLIDGSEHGTRIDLELHDQNLRSSSYYSGSYFDRDTGRTEKTGSESIDIDLMDLSTGSTDPDSEFNSWEGTNASVLSLKNSRPMSDEKHMMLLSQVHICALLVVLRFKIRLSVRVMGRGRTVIVL